MTTMQQQKAAEKEEKKRNLIFFNNWSKHLPYERWWRRKTLSVAKNLAEKLLDFPGTETP